MVAKRPLNTPRLSNITDFSVIFSGYFPPTDSYVAFATWLQNDGNIDDDYLVYILFKSGGI